MLNWYEGQSEKAFWAPSVGSKNPLDIDLDWRPKWPVRPTDSFASAGSCFAQHIGRALRRAGFSPCPIPHSGRAIRDRSQSGSRHHLNHAGITELHQSLMQDIHKDGLDFIPQPPASITPEGFTARRYGIRQKWRPPWRPKAKKDYIHMNADYGDLVLDEVTAWLATAIGEKAA